MGDNIKNEDTLKPYKKRFKYNTVIPSAGRDKDDILKELSQMASEENAKWQTGKISGTFYHGGKEHLDFLNKVYSLFSHANTIQYDLCPSMFKMESEIISMTAKMLNGGPEVCGTMTTGGSESILMAMKVYRDKARAEKGITAPEIIMPSTAHPAFNKACEYFGIKLVRVPVLPPDYLADVKAMEKAINKNS